MKALLLVTSSSRDVDFYYATKFWIEDPAIFIQVGAKKILALSQYEAGRARKEAKVDEIIDIQAYNEKKRLKDPSIMKVVSSLLRDLKVNEIIVPEYSSYQLGKHLEKQGFSLKVREPFLKERTVKTNAEVKYIVAVQRKMEEVLAEALEIIRKSRIKGKFLYNKKGEILTSEQIRSFINSELLKRGCVPEKSTIVSSGDQACDVHFFGSGSLMANSAIIIDIFPRSAESKYWSDMTRTVVKGKASPELKKLYNTVLAGQKKALALVKPGASGKMIDQTIRDFFISKGYQTGKIKGKMQGFVHGTGHGVGLDIHEGPRICQKDSILKAGNVITIEPGLYYWGLGGVRIEDTVVVTEKGCLNLAKFSKRLLEL